MTQPFLSIQGITKTYGDIAAVANVTLDIAQGEFVTFLGPSGSGKSTTLYAVAGFLELTQGDILLKGKSLLGAPPNKRNIGMVFQKYTLFPHLSVADNVAFPLRVRRWCKADIDAKVDSVLKLVRLEKMADRMPAKMSGGQQQRVALARALAYDPPLLLMDEPLSALDKKLKEELQFEIKRIHRETGVTILYVTHDQEEALRLSDRIALFNSGRIEQLGTGHELYEKPATRFVAGFIGNSNFLEGELEGGSRSSGIVAMPDGTRLQNLRLDALASDQKNVSIMIRPDNLRFCSGPEGPDACVIAGLVDATTFLGDHVHVAIKTVWGALLWMRVKPTAATCLKQGQRVRLVCDPEHVQVF
jgi:putative spermidine/putrescine transport system ATP-binding protein